MCLPLLMFLLTLTLTFTFNYLSYQEVELMESVKRQNQRLEEEIEEMGHKVKLRGTKIKFLKKHIKELEEQRQVGGFEDIGF